MFYLLNKPKGISSFKCINDFAKANKIKKIGHTGTLDPLASGLLLVATDDDTKLIPYIKDKTKTYITSIEFGKSTSTYDSEGTITNTSINRLKKSDINKAIQWLNSQKTQIPPLFSAKKINGARGYDLARKNIDFELKPQNIEVKKTKLIDFDEQNQILTVELTVSNGTYIRSLANDIGLAFDTFSYMKELERTSISTLHKNMLSNDNFVAIINSTPLLSIQHINVSFNQLIQLKNGLDIEFTIEDGEYLLTCEEFDKCNVLGIITANAKKIKPKKLFGSRLPK